MNNISKAVLENNMLIAKFMGLEHENNGLHFKVRFTENISRSYSYKNEDFRFDISWDWLMPVVKKIERTSINEEYYSFFTSISNVGTTIMSKTKLGSPNYDFSTSLKEETKLKSTYRAIIEFITFFNKLKNK